MGFFLQLFLDLSGKTVEKIITGQAPNKEVAIAPDYRDDMIFTA